MVLTTVVLPSVLLALPRLTASLALTPACHVSPPQLPASCTLHSSHSAPRGPWCTAHRLKERPPGSFICATLWRPCFFRNVPSSSRLLATALSAAGTAAVREKHGSICSSGAAEVKVRSSRSGSEVVAGASLERVTSHTCVNMLFLVEKVESRPVQPIVCQRLPRGAPHVRRGPPGRLRLPAVDRHCAKKLARGETRDGSGGCVGHVRGEWSSTRSVRLA